MRRDTLKSKRLILALPVAIFMWAAQPAAAIAQVSPVPGEVVEEGMWSITPFLGVGFGGNLEDSPLTLGFAAGYNVTPRIGVEGEFSYVRAAGQGVPITFDTSVYTFSGNVLYHFAAEQVAPYVTLGIGLGHARADLEGLFVDVDETSTEFALNFGGGVKANMGANLRFRGDVRYFNGNDLVPDFWRAYAGLQFLLGR
jgi:opacity protein-like surface antigen